MPPWCGIRGLPRPPRKIP